MKRLTIPISNEAVLDLHKGDPVALSGIMVLGRDAAHKWMHETFIKQSRQPQGDDLEVYEAIKPLLNGGAIYHCGPVVAGLDTDQGTHSVVHVERRLASRRANLNRWATSGGTALVDDLARREAGAHVFEPA